MQSISLFLLLSLTSCATSTEYVAPELPAADDGLTLCTGDAVPDLPGARGTGLTNEQVAGAIGDQRTAAKDKDRCAKAWKSFYEDLRKSIGGAK